jgi:hypothetical protein
MPIRTEYEIETISQLLAIDLPCCQVVSGTSGGLRICGEPASMTNGHWVFCAGCGAKIHARMMTNAEHIALVIQAQEPADEAPSSPA